MSKKMTLKTPIVYQYDHSTELIPTADFIKEKPDKYPTLKELEILKRSIYKEKKLEDRYFPKMQSYKYYPKISGLPKIVSFPNRLYIGRSTFSRKPIPKIMRAPKKCHIRKIFNYPVQKWGSTHTSVLGDFGEGKTDMVDLLTAGALARGQRIFTMNNKHIESQTLAAHGWFDKNDRFHPFELDFWIPKGYEFLKYKSPGEYYPNFKIKEYTNYLEIVKSMKPKRMTIVYEDCFTQKGRLKIFIDIMKAMAEKINTRIVHSFVHHELARLIPYSPKKAIHFEVDEASDIMMDLRRDRIGLITAYHIPTEVFFRVSYKFGYVIWKNPCDRPNKHAAEQDAVGFPKHKCNISKGGRWMTHEIHYFPQLAGDFGFIAQREKLDYPSLNPSGITEEEDTKVELTKDEHKLMVLRAKGVSWRKCAIEFGTTKGKIYHLGEKLGLV